MVVYLVGILGLLHHVQQVDVWLGGGLGLHLHWHHLHSADLDLHHIIWLLVVVIQLDWVDPDLLEDVTFTMDLGRVVLVFTYIGYINIFIHISDLVDPD